MDGQNLKKKIMRRVYTIWFVKRILPVVALEILALVIFVNVFASQVFVEKVVANTLAASVGNPLSSLGYLAVSFVNTSLTTQGVILLLALAGIFMFRDVGRAIVSFAVIRKNLPALSRI